MSKAKTQKKQRTIIGTRFDFNPREYKQVYFLIDTYQKLNPSQRLKLLKFTSNLRYSLKKGNKR